MVRIANQAQTPYSDLAGKTFVVSDPNQTPALIRVCAYDKTSVSDPFLDTNLPSVTTRLEKSMVWLYKGDRRKTPIWNPNEVLGGACIGYILTSPILLFIES